MEEFGEGSGKGETDISHNFFWVKDASMRDC